MEDPESEWEIQEYPSSKEGEPTMVRWILNKGCGIGKKVVITGIAVSSAPLVLPPLVVFSAMGVAFSVPFGLVFVSYACTNKLMSKLLPPPPPPASSLLLGYYGDEDEEEEEEGWKDDDFRRESMIRESEVEQVEDIKHGVECRFELDEGGYDDYSQEVEGLITNADGIIDKEGYYTKEGDDEHGRENVLQEEEDEQMEDIKQGAEFSFELDDGSDDYSQEVEALVTDADGIVDEKGYYTDEDEKEGDDGMLGRENVLQEEEEEEQMEDIKEGVKIGFKLDDDDNGGDYRQNAGVFISNADENVDEKGCYTVENEEEKEREDDELKRENVLQEEVGVGLDEGGDDYRQEAEALISNVDENVDEKSYHTNEEEKKEGGDDFFLRENAIKDEEKKQLEDIKQGVETRLQLDNMTNDEPRQAEERSITNFDGGVDEEGDEEDIGEYVEGDDDSFEEERKEEEPLVEEKNRNTREVDGLGMVAGEMEEDEEEEIVKGSTGLLKKVRDEGFLGESGSHGVGEEVKGVETTEPVIVKEVESQKLVKDWSKNGEEPIGEMRRVVVLAEGNEENNFNSRQVEEIDLVARQVLGDTDKDGRKSESKEKTNGAATNDDREEAILRTKKEHLIHSNADADVGCLDLFDDTSINIESPEDDEAKKNVANDNLDVVALPASKPAMLDSDHAYVASKADTKAPSREGLLEEEKMWEQIGAMRAIVGYRAPSQPTCIDELKALYVFTGVEPPGSIKGDSDLHEVNAKLKFLMSIVGVK